MSVLKVDISLAEKKQKALFSAAGGGGKGSAIHYQFTKWGGLAHKHIVRNVSGKIIGKYKQGTKSGQLRRNIKFHVKVLGRKYSLEIGSEGVKYAKVLEEGSGYLPGGVIRPVKAKYLTIPFPGVKGHARNYSDAFVMKSKSGNLILAKSEGNRLKALFLLKKEVKMPAYHWLEKSVEQKHSLLMRMMKPSELMRIAERLEGM